MPTTCDISRSRCPPTSWTRSPRCSTRATAPGSSRRRAYAESSAARLMTQDVLVLRDPQTVEEAIALIRRRGRLPAQTDRLFVVDSRNVLIGSIGLGALIIADPGAAVSSVMDSDVRRFLPVRRRTRGGEGVRTLRPAVGADRGRSRQVDRPRDGRRRDGLHPVVGGRRCAGARGTPEGRGSVRARGRFSAQPVAVARRQPRHGIHRLPRDWRIRAHHSAARGTGGADADRREHRREHRQPDGGARRARACARPDHREQRLASAAEGAARRLLERRAVGHDRGAVRDDRVPVACRSGSS